MINQREKNYDLLRSICIVMIVLLHWGCFFCGQNYSSDRLSLMIGYGAQSISRFAVPCFVMLTGAFILPRNVENNVKGFYKKSFFKIGVPIIVFSILYVALSYAKLFVGDNKGESGNKFQPLIDWLKGEPYWHMWFVYMLIGLYIIMPLVSLIKNNISKKKYLLIIVLFFVLGAVLEYTVRLPWPVQFIKYLGYLMVGDYIRNDTPKVGRVKIIFLIIPVIILAGVTIASYHFQDTKTYYQPLAPWIIIASVMIFIWFAMTNIKVSTAPFAVMSLFIYLISVGVMDVLNTIVTKKMGYLPAVWYLPVGFVITMLISVGLSKICMKFFKQ